MMLQKYLPFNLTNYVISYEFKAQCLALVISIKSFLILQPVSTRVQPARLRQRASHVSMDITMTAPTAKVLFV